MKKAMELNFIRSAKAPVISAGGRIGRVGLGADPAQEYVVQVADETSAVAERQTVAENPPQHRDNGHHRKALHHGAEDILLPHQTAVEKRQARTGHHEDEGRTGQHPGIVGGAFGVRGLLLQPCEPRFGNAAASALSLSKQKRRANQ
jgi:hypothetical protein